MRVLAPLAFTKLREDSLVPAAGAAAALLLALVACLCLPLAGCSKGENPAAMQRPPVPVLVAKAVARTVPNQLHEIGTVEAFATVNIKSRVEGQLVAIHFKEGEFVSKGQLLFTLDPRTYEAGLKLAEANLAKDRAQLAQAQTDEKRYGYLLRENVGSREQYDQIHANAAALRATAVADQAAIETARLNLQYSQIRSLIDGRTGNLQSHIGDLIKPDSDNPLVTITQVQPIYVNFSLPESQLPAVRSAMESHPLEVDATIPNSQEPTEHGMLAFVDNTVDKTTGTILLKGLFQNENRRLWPGEFVNATLTLNEIPGAILIPTQAIQNGQNGAFVFIVDRAMKAQARPVVAGAAYGGDTIIEHGVAAGETVVTDGQLLLGPGASVRIKTQL
ncbi:MAG TPA: efflux RND transporter periplasmic adaptor subunit [Candidatus Binataceae bacterium]|nr:efflux RND transporter periplasmic adaptor subunit [Candidatus Binataceae bacterium]